MAEAAQKMSKKEVMRYATEQLHAVRPQPAGIPNMLAALQATLDEAEATAIPVEEAPKDFSEALSRIDAAVGKLEHPPKEKADLKAISGPANSEPQGPAPQQEPKPKPK